MSQVKNELRQFVETTTLHGIEHAACEKNHSWIRLAWTLAVLLMLGTYVSMLCQTLIVYFNYPVVTNVEYLTTDSLAFPSVTICNENIAKYSVVKQKAEVRAMFTPPDTQDNLSVDPNELDMVSVSLLAAHKPSDMYLECGFDGVRQSPCNVDQEVSWSASGFCHTFNSPQIISRYGEKITTRPGESFGLYLLINIQEYEHFKTVTNASGIKVQIHDQWELPNILERGFVVAPGTATLVSMKKTVVSRLPEPYAKAPNLCEDSTKPSYQNPLKYFPHYSLSACHTECRIAHQLSLCNCSGHTLGGNNVTKCRVKEFHNCGHKARAEFDANPPIAAACDCKPTCEETVYDVSVSSTGMPNRLEKERLVRAVNIPQINSSNIQENIIIFKVFFEDMRYTLIKQQSQYKAASLFGELGGQLGLCLGASVLTICELLQLLGALCAGIFRRPAKNVNRIDVQMDNK